MLDSELSLAVARIMWPEREWQPSKFDPKQMLIISRDEAGWVELGFNHTTDDALGKMCVWLANWGVDNCDAHNIREWMADRFLALALDEPNRVIAEALVEASDEASKL